MWNLYRIKVLLNGQEVQAIYQPGTSEDDAMFRAKWTHWALLENNKITCSVSLATEDEALQHHSRLIRNQAGG